MSRTPRPPIETVLMTQAAEALSAGRLEEAVELFSASLAIAPQQAQALRGRGVAYSQLQQWASAATDFAAAKALVPEEPENWIDLGIALAADHKIYPALEIFETLLTRHPDCVRGHIELGLLHLRVGAITKGRTQLQHALTRRPTLEQRRLIESILREQEKLDRKRLYRPDFEALHQQRAQQEPTFLKISKRMQALINRLRGRAT